MLNPRKAYGIPEMGLARIEVRGFDGLLHGVCRKYGVQPWQVTQRGVRGTREVSTARGEMCRLLRAEGCSLLEIGRLLMLDHTTVLHHLRTPKSGSVQGPKTPLEARRETISYPNEALL